MFKSLINEPLIHFILIGVGLFIVSDLISNDESSSDQSRVTVSRNNLLTYMQYQAKTVSPHQVAQRFDLLPENERQTLIDRYINDEVLYREAKALGLGQNDYMAKQRSIQQMRYLTRSLIETDTQLTEAALQHYYAANTQDYFEPAKVTFSHVYIRNKKDSKAVANALVKELNEKKLSFHEAPSYGDLFLYHRNYVAKEREDIVSHFGERFAEAVFTLKPSETLWYGPIASDHGQHLLMVSTLKQAYVPPLDEVRNKVSWDFQQAQVELAYTKALQHLVASYSIELEKELTAGQQ